MQFLTSLFGGDGNTILSTLLALGIVLVLIVLSVWLLKFVFRASENVARGRNRRLMLVETLQVDPRRQVLIVRRDDVEHVILTGGAQDVVLETGIAVEAAPRRVVPVQVQSPAETTTPPYFADEPVQTDVPPPQTAVERLREFTRPLGQRASSSLRHTGLMRGSRMEVIPGSLDRAIRDSAKSNPFLKAEGDEAEFERDFKAGGKS